MSALCLRPHAVTFALIAILIVPCPDADDGKRVEVQIISALALLLCSFQTVGRDVQDPFQISTNVRVRKLA